MRPVAVLLIATLAACGGDSTSSTPPDAATTDDALPVFNCWPTIEPIPRGTVVLGTGRDAFETMPDMLPLEYGSQDGFMVKVRTRMTDFVPGASPITNPANPFTRVRAFFADTGQPLQPPTMCAAREWYVPGSTEAYDLSREYAVVFDVCWRVDRLIGARLRIEAELMDATGSYATDVKIVTAVEPVSPPYPIDETPPTCGM